MWNTDTRKECEEDGVAENHTLAGTSEVQANPSFAKRQRRRNVRLEEIKDQHLFSAADKRKKKTGKLVCVSNGSFDDGDDAQRGDKALLCCPNGPTEPCPAFIKATKLQQILKITGKKDRNRGRKPGAPEVDASVKKSPCAPLSGTSMRAHYKQKVSRMRDAKDIHFDKENNADTPARFEASGYNDVISPFERRDRGDMVLLHAHQNYQSGEHMPSRALARAESESQWTQASSRRHALKLTDDADGKRMPHTDRFLHIPKGKLVVKANRSMHGTRNALIVEADGNGDNREPSKKNAARQFSRPWLGVREWLEELGLGKYAQLFEAHEVEPEVLPLLTLDDLREMGVVAVGSRRKMFYAIQHVRKTLFAEIE